MNLRRRLVWPALLAALVAAAMAQAGDTGPVTLRADVQKVIGDTYRRLEGNVEVLYQDIKIRCDVMELDLATMDLHAVGHVVMDQGPQRFTCDEATFNLRTKVGRFLRGGADIQPTYHVTADEIEKLDDTHYRLRHATFTSCDPQPRPPWRFTVSRALLEQEGYGRFRGAGLQVKNVPVFYFPYILWPLKSERAMGLLVPSFGYTQRRGAYLGNALFVPLGRSYDVRFDLDLYSRGTFGIGNRWRWAPVRDAEGEIDLYTIYDNIGRRWEWRVNGKHRQSDFLGFRMLAEVHDVSDIDFFREFERSYDRNTLRSLYSYIYLTRSLGTGSLNIRLDHRTTYLSSGDIVLSQLPEVELRVRPTRVGHSQLYWSLISSLNLFDVDRGGELSQTYARADVFPRLSWSLPGPPWLNVTPRVGARGTYYTARLSEDHRTYESEGIDRSYAEAGLDLVGPSFSRVFDWQLGRFQRFKHLVEPRIEYSYVSDVGETDRIPRFDEVDSTLVTNKVRLSLVNSLYGRSEDSAREVASFVLFQDYSLADPLTWSADRSRESKRGPLNAALRLTPSYGFYLDARVSYDTLFDALRSTSLSASVRKRHQYLNLTWYQGYIPETGDRTSSQVRVSTGLGDPEHALRLQLGLNYDMERSEFVQQRAILRYTGSCWAVSVEYRDFSLGLYPTRDYRISIDFKGIGRFLEIRGGLGAAED